jgi:hypothetical protein
MMYETVASKEVSTYPASIFIRCGVRIFLRGRQTGKAMCTVRIALKHAPSCLSGIKATYLSTDFTAVFQIRTIFVRIRIRLFKLSRLGSGS